MYGLPVFFVAVALSQSVSASLHDLGGGDTANIGNRKYRGNGPQHPQVIFASGQTSTPCASSSDLPHSIFSHLAQYSPWFPAAQYTPPADTCKLDQVHLLHRHASRFPTSGAGRIIQASISRIQSAVARKGPASTLSWLLDYSYDLGTDGLVPLGITESRESAQCAYSRYGHLAKETGVFVRSSSCERVVHTAKCWSQALSEESKKSIHIPPLLVISDAITSNDTLANNGCPRHIALRSHWDWAETFTPKIAARLRLQLVDYDVTIVDVVVLMSMCAFQSVADGQISKFCTLFTKEEYREYEYFNDLEKYYNTGYGNPLGPVLGVGYVNELIARLTGRQVEDCTQTNSTLDSHEETFPLGKGMYADFSHDNTMAAIVSAMGLFPTSSHDMPLHRVNTERLWKFGHIAPFSGRIAFERLVCEDGVKRVRVLANDALLNLEICGSDEHGMCTLDDFVASQRFARFEGQKKWEQCFASESTAME